MSDKRGMQSRRRASLNAGYACVLRSWIDHRVTSARRDNERQAMAKATVETLVDDLDGSQAVETIRIGWNGDWREIDLSKRNLGALSRTFDRFWDAGRPVAADGQASRRRKRASARSRKAGRDPKVIRAWAVENGIELPARGRIPAAVERQYHEANGGA